MTEDLIATATTMRIREGHTLGIVSSTFYGAMTVHSFLPDGRVVAEFLIRSEGLLPDHTSIWAEWTEVATELEMRANLEIGEVDFSSDMEILIKGVEGGVEADGRE